VPCGGTSSVSQDFENSPRSGSNGTLTGHQASARLSASFEPRRAGLYCGAVSPMSGSVQWKGTWRRRLQRGMQRRQMIMPMALNRNPPRCRLPPRIHLARPGGRRESSDR